VSDASASELHIDVAAFLPEGTEVDTSEAAEVDEPVEVDELGPDAVGPDPVTAAPEATDPGASDAAVPEAAVDLAALDQVERDLAAVDAAIAALDAGTYGTDPATGAAIDDAVLAEDPTRLS
jgi:hypothetical protein